jgi:hypothetical protein
MGAQCQELTDSSRYYEWPFASGRLVGSWSSHSAAAAPSAGTDQAPSREASADVGPALCVTVAREGVSDDDDISAGNKPVYG